ncbi:MAG: peptidoglycan-binding protein [Candidatus Omnitrophica bacterium]|nr:peptidoglycan-binding protein [Candidatus Omnitrophota bacterium]
MKTKVTSLAIVFFFAAGWLTPVPVAEAAITAAHCTARSLVVYDPAQSRILFSKTPHARRPPASTTKVLTALVVVERMNLNRAVTVRKDTSHVPRTKLYLRPGETFRVKDLLKALLISSSNDVACVLAHQVSGSEAAFAKLMNQKARRIGARNTHFVNPHGLPAVAQYSTPYDLALMMNEVKKYPFIMQTLATRRTTIRSFQGRRFNLKNHNKMLWKDSRPIIGKTGFTRRALHCFVGRINYRNRDVMVAIMGSVRPWRDLKIILDFYQRVSFENAKSQIQKNKMSWSRRRMLVFEKTLKRSGFNPGKVDGVVTAETVHAVKAFQKRYQLPQTGYIGPLTTAKLKKFT